MIKLKLPGSHPNSPVIQRWADDKENILNGHTTDIGNLRKMLQTILTNNPDLGKPK